MRLAGDLLAFGAPIFLNYLLSYIENPTETWEGYAAAGLLVGCSALSSLVILPFNYRIAKVGLALRATVISSVYSKSLSISQRARSSKNINAIIKEDQPLFS